MKLEIIGFNIESCIAAQDAGADRIELCDNPGEGGTTPSYGFIKAAREKLSIDLYVIIRPRGGDFCYSSDEFEIMKSNIEICKYLGCDGVVLGILKEDGSVDKVRCKVLLEAAYPMNVTFHRAFDRTNNPAHSLEEIIELGFERILTSGLQPHAIDGIELLHSLIQQADGRIIIMPGSGVNSANIVEIASRTGCTELHSSARILEGGKKIYLNPAMNENLKYAIADVEEIKNMVQALKNAEISISP